MNFSNIGDLTSTTASILNESFVRKSIRKWSTEYLLLLFQYKRFVQKDSPLKDFMLKVST